MSQENADPSQILSALSEALAAAVDRASPSVVRIEARRRQSQGTGIIWRTSGLVLTADHVLERSEDVTVGLPDGKTVPATVVGRDSERDVALLRAPVDGLPPIEAGPAARVGHLVVAVGRPGEQIMATVGVVNAIGTGRRRRRVDRPTLIHTDALLYPGFSGGPLLDSAGRVIGLNTSRMRAGAGIAIAIDAVTQVAEALQAGGKLKRGYLGITSQPVALPGPLQTGLGLEQQAGLLVSEVEADTPAERGGLILGDVLLTVGEQRVEDPGDLQAALSPERIGQALAVTILRAGELRELSVTVAERP